jgi:hypothetical protein
LKLLRIIGAVRSGSVAPTRSSSRLSSFPPFAWTATAAVFMRTALPAWRWPHCLRPERSGGAPGNRRLRHKPTAGASWPQEDRAWCEGWRDQGNRRMAGRGGGAEKLLVSACADCPQVPETRVHETIVFG